MTTPTLIRAAELLEEDAQALFECHTVNDRWPDNDEADRDAKKHHAQLIEIASRLRAIQRGFESSDDYGRTLCEVVTKIESPKSDDANPYDLSQAPGWKGKRS